MTYIIYNERYGKMGVLSNADFYTSETNPTEDVNPKAIGAVWINTKTCTQFICKDNTKNKNVWGSSWDTIYPVGSLFITVTDIDPNVHFGGKWRKETGDKTIWLSESGAGENLSAGLPNIYGEWSAFTEQIQYGPYGSGSPTGAFKYIYNQGWVNIQGSGRPGLSQVPRVGIDASVSSSIYGNSSTVQPKAIKVYCWIREA